MGRKRGNGIPAWNRMDLTGQRYGKLTVVKEAAKILYPGGQSMTSWECLCDCGVVKNISLNRLRVGTSTDCGCGTTCRRKEISKTHGDAKSKEHNTWCSIKSRCNNKNNDRYSSYGGRGIMVCDKWLNSYESFFADMGRAPSPKHSLDRINNDGNYSAENCRWATNTEQSNNKRNTVMLEFNGEIKALRYWAEELGYNYNNMRYLIGKRGKTIEELVAIKGIQTFGIK